MRVGYGAFPLSIIEYMWRAKQPYNVSATAELAAYAALSNGDYLEVGGGCKSSLCGFPNLPFRAGAAWSFMLIVCLFQFVKEALVTERNRLFQKLKEVPYLVPYESHANFILCNVVNGKDAKQLKVRSHYAA